MSDEATGYYILPDGLPKNSPADPAAMWRAEPQALPALAGQALVRLRALVARAGAVIHGAETSADETAEADATQAAVDALFER